MQEKICQEFDAVTAYQWNGMNTLSEAILLALTQCAVTCTVTRSSVPDALKAELKLWLHTVKPTIKSTWTVRYLVLLILLGI